MTPTIEGNKLIAEFMEEEDISAIFQTEPFVTEVRISHKSINELEKQGAEVRLYYHDNWNKLMPVVEKIAAMDNEDADGLTSWEGYEDLVLIQMTSILCHKQEVYNRVIQFITWYNQQNQKQ